MSSDVIRRAITDYIGNFMSTLYEKLIKYNDFEKIIKKGFTTHTFKPEEKRKQSRF